MAKPMTTLVSLLLVLLAAAFIAAPAPVLAFQAELGRCATEVIPEPYERHEAAEKAIERAGSGAGVQQGPSAGPSFRSPGNPRPAVTRNLWSLEDLTRA